MLRKFRISTRLLLSFFIVVAFTMIVGLTGFASLTSISKSAVKTIHNVTILNDIYDNNVFIDYGLFNMLYISDSTLIDYILQTTKEHTDHLLTQLKEYVAIQDRFSDVFTPGEMQDMENLLEIYSEAYIPVAYEIFDLMEQGRKEEALSVYINRLTPIFNTFTYYLNLGFIKNLENSDTKMKENNDKASSNIYLMLTLVAMSLIASVLLSLAVTKSIASPLAELGLAAEKVANGNLDVKFEQSQSNDEIAQLSLRLQETLYHLNQIQQLKLEAVEARLEKEKAEAASKSKDDFLAKMSHEIRTPMNAIIGMAELALRENRLETIQEQIITIKQAGGNLLSIINDILDFSKIESGKLEIVPVNYRLSSLINDTINIIRMRLMEKPIRFFTNIDGNIPNSLIGDETRLRQIFLNLLTNAVKYSEKGHIGLTITADKRDEKQVWLRIAVADTGKGIRKEDQAKLFDEFVKVDEKNNQGIEGTGLGLVITKRLCAVMGGDISIESEYGKGSVFTAVIPQGIESESPFAAVEEAQKKKILVYEGRSVYAQAVCWTLKNLNVPHTLVTNQDDFTDSLNREEWFYVFSSYGLYQKIKPVMESSTSLKGEVSRAHNNSNFYKGKKPPLALMVEWGTEAYIPGARFVSIPIQSLSIANVLNGKTDGKDIKNADVINFTFPRARLLVVDDIATNLKVVEGLLAPYHAAVDTSMNGLQAIEMVKQAVSDRREYDIVFMDHMMPGMDGIETTHAIRTWEKEQQENNGNPRKQIPIIALTANAVVGVREMFIENGFNDFLSKPIDVSKLDEILNRWIAEEKKAMNNEQLTISNKGKNMENEKKLIVLVDDNPANLRIGKNVLMEKYTVATAPSAEKMFSLLENNKPDLILLDVEMPEMNGYETIKILKSKPETKNIPVIFVTARNESDDELAGLSLGAIDYIIKPFQPPLLLKRIEMHLLLETQKKKLEKQAADLIYFSDNLQKMVFEKTENIMELQNALLKTMAELVECRDDITGGHIERTQRGIKILLEEIKKSGVYSEETKGWDVELLLQSCQLHDVGKISIDDNILKKPGKLTAEEFNEMKKHASFGEAIIEKIKTLAKESDFLKYAKIFAASHHEKWDGSGYPRGLKGEEIPLLGRIMAIADVYDALTSARPYKKAFSHEKAIQIITESGGIQFDPTLIEIFTRAAEQFRN